MIRNFSYQSVWLNRFLQVVFVCCLTFCAKAPDAGPTAEPPPPPPKPAHVITEEKLFSTGISLEKLSNQREISATDFLLKEEVEQIEQLVQFFQLLTTDQPKAIEFYNTSGLSKKGVESWQGLETKIKERIALLEQYRNQVKEALREGEIAEVDREALEKKEQLATNLQNRLVGARNLVAMYIDLLKKAAVESEKQGQGQTLNGRLKSAQDILDAAGIVLEVKSVPAKMPNAEVEYEVNIRFGRALKFKEIPSVLPVLSALHNYVEAMLRIEIDFPEAFKKTGDKGKQGTILSVQRDVAHQAGADLWFKSMVATTGKVVKDLRELGLPIRVVSDRQEKEILWVWDMQSACVDPSSFRRIDFQPVFLNMLGVSKQARSFPLFQEKYHRSMGLENLVAAASPLAIQPATLDQENFLALAAAYTISQVEKLAEEADKTFQKTLAGEDDKAKKIAAADYLRLYEHLEAAGGYNDARALQARLERFASSAQKARKLNPPLPATLKIESLPEFMEKVYLDPK